MTTNQRGGQPAAGGALCAPGFELHPAASGALAASGPGLTPGRVFVVDLRSANGHIAQFAGQWTVAVVDDDTDAEALFALGYDDVASARPADLTRALLRASRRLAVSADGPIRDEPTFRRMVEESPDLVSVIDFEGNFRYVNRAHRAILGYEAAELEGRLATSIVHPDDHPIALQGIVDTVEGRDGSATTLRLRHRDGRWLACEVNAALIDDGEGQAIVVVAHDKTALLGAAAELRRLSTILAVEQQASRDGILVVDPDGHAISWNRRFIEIWGIDEAVVAAGLQARTSAVLAKLADPDEAQAVVRRAYSSPESSAEAQVRLLDGRTLDLYTAPLRADDGENYGRVWYYRDISDRVNAEAELRDSEQRYRRLVELSPSAIAVHQGGVIRYVNAATQRLLNRKAADLVGTNAFAFVRPEDRRAIAAAASSRDDITATFVEARLVDEEGEELFVELASGPTAFGGRPATQTVSRDLTACRAAESALRESEERYRVLVEQSADPIVVHDGERFFYANPAAIALAGCRSAGELIGRPIFEVISPIDPQESGARLKRVIAGETFRLVERRTILSTGRDLDLEMTWSPVVFGGKPAVQTVLRDLTEARRAEEERKALERKVLETQRLESLGVLAGGVAHDFNNLLVAIMGNAGLAMMQAGAEPELQACLREIETAAERAAELARQMLAYSGRGRIAIAPVKLNDLVEEMGHLLAVSLPNNVTLRYNLAADLPTTDADATQLRQIVMNLVINAGEAMSDGDGAIGVETGVMVATADYLARSHLSPDLPAGEYVYLEVRDTGPGMDEKTLARIFDPFFTTKFTGRGLGLAAVLGIVRAHKGAIRIDTAPGQGTAFRLLLPVSAGAPTASGVARAAGPQAPPKPAES